MKKWEKILLAGQIAAMWGGCKCLCCTHAGCNFAGSGCDSDKN
ncbi:MAG: hypothetical protein E6Z24_08105 [Dialister sp.]|nr:hypothetical protein [Dialister sp.]